MMCTNQAAQQHYPMEMCPQSPMFPFPSPVPPKWLVLTPQLVTEIKRAWGVLSLNLHHLRRRKFKDMMMEKANRKLSELCKTFLPALLLNQIKYLFQFFLYRQTRFECLQFWTMAINTNRGLNTQGILDSCPPALSSTALGKGACLAYTGWK